MEIFGKISVNGRQTLDSFQTQWDQYQHDPSCYFFEGDTYQVIVRSSGIRQTVASFTCLNTENLFVLFVGRIDNQQALCDSLHIPNNTKRLLYKAYSLWGNQMAKSLLGAYNLLVVDKKTQEHFISNDHYNFKPLYYTPVGHHFVFGNDIRRLIKVSGISLAVNQQNVKEFLSPVYVIDEFGVSQERSFFEKVSKLPFASTISVQNQNPPISYAVEQYWYPQKAMDRSKRSYQDYADEFDHLFREILEEQGSHSSQIGCELSGGIDSSSLLCGLQHLNKDQHPIRTYTLTGGTETWDLEQDKINDILQLYPNTVPTYIPCDPLYDYIENTNYAAFRPIDHPNLLNLPTALASIINRAQKDGCQMLFSGEGADWYLEGIDLIWDSMIKTKQWKPLWSRLKKTLSKGDPLTGFVYLLSTMVPSSLPKRVSDHLYLKKFYPRTINFSTPDVFTDNFLKELKPISDQFREKLIQNNDFEYWAQRLEFELILPPNHNWQSLQFDLEYMLPYLDRRMIEFGLSVPPEYKFRIEKETKSFYGGTKVLQREGLRSILPPSIANSQIKSVYSNPVTKRVVLGVEYLLKKKDVYIIAEGITTPAKLKSSLAILQDKKVPLATRHDVEAWLDSLLNLEMWLQTVYHPSFLDSPAAVPVL